MPQITISARVRKSPFFDATLRHGVTHFSIYNHMYMATSYGDPKGEYRRLMEGVSIWDVACERQVELCGADAAALAQYLCPRDLSNCQVGQGLYVPMCDHDGRIINDPILLKLAEDRFWLSIADSDMLLWTRAIKAERGFDVDVFEPDVSPLAIQGPKAEVLAVDLFGEWVKDLRYFWFKEVELAGIPLVVARSGWSKQGGFELYLTDGTRGEELWNIVWQAGQPYGIGAGTPNATERIESALVSYGTETDDDTNPLELGLERFISLEMPQDFIGKAALQRIVQQGVMRKLAGLLIQHDAPLSAIGHKCRVSSNGEEVGFASATTYSWRLGKNIGIALLGAEVVDGVETVTVHLPEGEFDAKLTSLPF